jgi:hypothetical protein
MAFLFPSIPPFQCVQCERPSDTEKRDGSFIHKSQIPTSRGSRVLTAIFHVSSYNSETVQ